MSKPASPNMIRVRPYPKVVFFYPTVILAGIYSFFALFGMEPQRVIGLFTRDQNLKTDILSSAILDFGRGRSVFTVTTQGFRAQTVDIYGTSGSIHVGIPFNMHPDVPPLLTVITPIGQRHPQLPEADQYGLEFEAFSEALRRDLPVPTPAEDAVANQRVLDALFRSETSGRWESCLGR